MSSTEGWEKQYIFEGANVLKEMFQTGRKNEEDAQV